MRLSLSSLRRPAVAVAAVDPSAVGAVPFEAWVDDEGRLRRSRLGLELPGSEATGGQPLTSTTTIELHEPGAEVAVAPPPPDQVQGGAPLLEALRGAAG